MGRQAIALLGQLDAACTAADDLEHAAVESFNLHPDAGIITSFPGLGALTGARVLAEIATTDPGSRMPKDSRPTQARPPSPAPAARPDPSPAATSRTTGSTPPATAGRSPR